jgi:hypothetical protein
VIINLKEGTVIRPGDAFEDTAFKAGSEIVKSKPARL